MDRTLQPVGAVEIRIALDHLRGLLRGLLRLTGGEVGPADVHVDQRCERIERQRLSADGHRLVHTPLEDEKQPVIGQGFAVVRIELDRPDERLLGAAPVPVVEERDDREGEIRVSEAVVDGQRARVGRLALRDHLLGRQDAEEPLAAACRGDARVRRRVIGFAGRSPSRRTRSPAASPAACTCGQVTALQEQLVRVGVVGVALSTAALRVAEQLHLQRSDDRQRDLVLQLEDIAHLAVVALGPHLIAVGGVDELHRDAQPVTGPPDAALEHAVDAKRLGDRRRFDRLALEREGRRARGDLQRVDLRQCVQQFFSQTVAEVLVVAIRAHVGEWQDRQGRHSRAAWLLRPRSRAAWRCPAG